MVRLSALLLVLAVSVFGEAFVVSPPTTTRRGFSVNKSSSVLLHAGFGKDKDSGGGAALAKPAVKIGQKTALVTETKQKVQVRKQVGEPVSRREEEFEEAPLYKLMLIGDDAYDLGHVVERMCAIVEGMDEDMAANVFQQAQQEGKAMCGKYPMEHAEMYKEQLIRSDPMIFADLEEENE